MLVTTYEVLMLEKLEQIKKEFKSMIKLTTDFKESNIEMTLNSVELSKVDTGLCNLIEGGVWFIDNLNGKRISGKGSMTKKVRKALGFLIP